LELKAPSRLGQRDATLFNASPETIEYASRYLGWVGLAANPVLPIAVINEQAQAILAEGLDAVVLIGQGGSSQASMTLTKLQEVCGQGNGVAFRTMDSLSPVFVNHILGSSDPARTLYIVSSKSGSTLEPLSLERVAWHYVSAHLGPSAAARRFVAITDPGSQLEQLAHSKGYREVFNSPADVGGRFSALTVFALFPAALVGIDIAQAVQAAALTEKACTSDEPANPALKLAAFLVAGQRCGRDKFSLILPPSGQVFGLWVEQLVAESLGKHGVGILPNVEVDASILSTARTDRSVIVYEVGETDGFSESIGNISPEIPLLRYTIDGPLEAFSSFVLWEYAIAFAGILLGVNPFDQPDVELTKQLVRELLAGQSGAVADGQQSGRSAAPAEPGAVAEAGCGTAAASLKHPNLLTMEFAAGTVRAVHVAPALLSDELADIANIDQALRALLGSLADGDYFSLNAFLPFRGYGRREALERMRNRVASRLGAAACLEIGPRYLHSTGQLHKGGPNNGVFLIISAMEENDIAIPEEHYTLGTLAATLAHSDFLALAARGRRAVHIQLADNDSETLSHFADRLCSAVSAVH
jgi:glucose-6-phosphate isomerase